MMTPQSRFKSVLSLLSFRLFLVLFLSILVLFTVHAVVCSRFQSRLLENLVKSDAYRASDLIRQSLLTSMVHNDRERTYAMITLLGNEPGVEAIRIYDKAGKISYSSVEDEIGSSVDLQAEACVVCHSSVLPLERVPTEERARIYRKAGAYRVLGLINPIYNEARCWGGACHAHGPDQSVLGVLDVQMSMRSLDDALASSRRRTFALATSIIFVSMLIIAAIIYRAVHVPTQKLRRGTEMLARGDLDFEIELRRSDELGELAASFNHMVRSLRQADAELRAWSRRLEERVRDKTQELEEIHERMVQIEKAASLGRMAATVAHELNNPLSGILTYAKLVARKLSGILPEGSERQHLLENLELIRSESMRCGNIVRDLLTYARHSSAELQPAHLHELIGRALKLVGHHTELGQVKTETELQLDDDSLICDAEQIVQALIALLINAVEAMPEGGELKLRTWEVPHDPYGRICLSVSDTGVGMPEDARKRIFDPFFSTKSDTKGVGLGLAVVYGIVKRHEGEIFVTSRIGEGTTFTIWLPRDPEAISTRYARQSRENLANL